MAEPENPPTATGETPPRPKRPWTILGRLSKAVREQNWFAVVLEVCIVIVGIVIGFQVTAWGQARADRAKEQTYLHQLVEDLRETERLMTDADQQRASPYRAISLMHRAFYTPERPPSDSLLAWIRQSYSAHDVRPVVGTAEALIATGDLSLIRSDPLRSAITEYLENTHKVMERLGYFSDELLSAGLRLNRIVDPVPLLKDVFPPEAMEADFGLRSDETAFFEGERRTPFPFDAEQFLTDRDANVVVVTQFVAYLNLWRTRGDVRSDAASLREQVEAELNR